jgi:tetrahydromethanopterin S-methyltransferase subunit C
VRTCELEVAGAVEEEVLGLEVAVDGAYTNSRVIHP